MDQGGEDVIDLGSQILQLSLLFEDNPVFSYSLFGLFMS